MTKFIYFSIMQRKMKYFTLTEVKQAAGFPPGEHTITKVEAR